MATAMHCNLNAARPGAIRGRVMCSSLQIQHLRNLRVTVVHRHNTFSAIGQFAAEL